MPYVQVNAGTRIRDRWTREFVSGCALSFTATSGDITNKTYTNYPFNAWYAWPWTSGENGYFPTNVILMRVNYDLKIAKSGYDTLERTNAIQNPGLGEVTNLGTLWLSPMDINANGIADSWEDEVFWQPIDRRQRRMPTKTVTTIMRNTWLEQIRRIETV